jgi:hypothetical protein
MIGERCSTPRTATQANHHRRTGASYGRDDRRNGSLVGVMTPANSVLADGTLSDSILSDSAFTRDRLSRLIAEHSFGETRRVVSRRHLRRWIIADEIDDNAEHNECGRGNAQQRAYVCDLRFVKSSLLVLFHWRTPCLCL